MANLSITAANVIPTNTLFVRGTAAAAIAAGELIAKTAEGLKLADANGAAAVQRVDGIAVSSAATGQPLNYLEADENLTLGASGVEVPVDVYVLSNTPGRMCLKSDLTSGSKVIFVAVGKGDGKVNFRPLAGGAVPA